MQDTAEQQTVLTLATQAHVDVSFATADLYLSIDDFAERILKPAMNNLAGAVAVDLMTCVDTGFIPVPTGGPASSLTALTGGACNIVANLNGSILSSPTTTTFLQANAFLSDNSAPFGRYMVVDPWTEAITVSQLSGLFNPSQAISRQYETGQMKSALGFDWFMDQTVIKHTTGSYNGAATVNGANQTGTSLTVTAISGTLNAGDIITLGTAGNANAVLAVNRVTKQSTGKQRQFVVTANVASGATTIPIYPSIVPSISGNAVQYQTVNQSPATGAAVNLFMPASGLYRKAFGYAPKAITMASGDLPIPRGNVDAARAKYDNVSLRMATQWQVGTDQEITRLDTLYGGLVVRPEWVCSVADTI